MSVGSCVKRKFPLPAKCGTDGLTRGRNSCTLTGMRKKLLPVFCATVLMLTACQQQQQQKAEAEEEVAAVKTPPPLHLGAVHQVYPEQNFALLRIIGPMPGPGVTLITHPPDGSTDRIGNLVISTGQPTRNNIVAADIRSGTVVKGDRVFRYRNIAEPVGKEQETPMPATEENSDDMPYPTAAATVAAPTPREVIPEDENSTGGDTIIETVDTPATDSRPTAIQPAASGTITAPDYLNDIPDDINKWD